MRPQRGSRGGGALTAHLKNPETWTSVSTFAPIGAPMRCAQERKALANDLSEVANGWLGSRSREFPMTAGAGLHTPSLRAAGFVVRSRMDDVFAPDGAIDGQALRALCVRSDTKGLAQIAGHAVALAATGSLVAQAEGTPWLAPAWLAHGILVVFLFAPLHETIHRTAFRTRWLNDAVAWVCGAVLLLPLRYFRAFHFAHHRHTQDPMRDPELATPKPDSLSRYLLYVSGLPYWRQRTAALLRHATGRVDQAFIVAPQRPAVVREARLVLSLYAAILAASLILESPVALTYWAIPALLGQPVLRLYLLAEHTGCTHARNPFKNTRTIRTHWLLQRLAWNMPYHVEHHAYPALPFHALPTAHGLLKDRIAQHAPGYVAVHREIIAGLHRPAATRS